jgi:hypothetical protein
MARAGFRPDDRAALARLGAILAQASGWEGIFTHFHSADTDPASAAPQWDQLQQVIHALGRRPKLVHAASSGGVFADHRFGADLARPGIYLYGGKVGSSSRVRSPDFNPGRSGPEGESGRHGELWSHLDRGSTGHPGHAERRIRRWCSAIAFQYRPHTDR